MILLAAIAGKVLSFGEFHAYPTVSMATGPGEVALIAAVVAGGALPFAGARARLGVAHG